MNDATQRDEEETLRSDFYLLCRRSARSRQPIGADENIIIPPGLPYSLAPDLTFDKTDSINPASKGTE